MIGMMAVLDISRGSPILNIPEYCVISRETASDQGLKRIFVISFLLSFFDFSRHRVWPIFKHDFYLLVQRLMAILEINADELALSLQLMTEVCLGNCSRHAHYITSLSKTTTNSPLHWKPDELLVITHTICPHKTHPTNCSRWIKED